MTTTSRSKQALEAVPKIDERTRYCGRCKQTVAPHEYATTMCLDCVFASYTENFNG